MKKMMFCLALLAPTAWAQVPPGTAPAPAAPGMQPGMVAPAPPAAPLRVRPMTDAEAAYAAKEGELVRKLRLLELQAKVAEQERKLLAPGAIAGAPGLDAVNALPAIPQPVMRQGSLPAAPAMADAPVKARPEKAFSVASIWGVEGNYFADLMAGGMRISVRKGDALPKGWRVYEVLRTGIVIEKGKERQTIQVGG
jgi:type IV pilus biogenesis protein PilP